MELSELRREIDAVDQQLLPLFLRRCALSKEVAAAKQDRGLPLWDPRREAEILETRREGTGEEAPYVEALFKTLFHLSRLLQAGEGHEEPDWDTLAAKAQGPLRLGLLLRPQGELAAWFQGLSTLPGSGIRILQCLSTPWAEEEASTVFFLELEAKLQDPGVREALRDLARRCGDFRLLGHLQEV